MHLTESAIISEATRLGHAQAVFAGLEGPGGPSAQGAGGCGAAFTMPLETCP